MSTLKNALTQDPTNLDRARRLMRHLNDAAFDFYIETLVTEGEQNKDRLSYRTVQKSFIRHIICEEGPRDVIPGEVWALLDPTYVSTALRTVKGSLNLMESSDSAKVEVFRQAVIEFPNLERLGMCRRDKNFKELMRSIHSYDSSDQVLVTADQHASISSVTGRSGSCSKTDQDTVQAREIVNERSEMKEQQTILQSFHYL